MFDLEISLYLLKPNFDEIDNLNFEEMLKEIYN